MPPEFDEVHPGLEAVLENGTPLWDSCEQALVTMRKCLCFLGKHIKKGTIAPGVDMSKGNEINAFLYPPVRVQTATVLPEDGICLVFTDKVVAGLRRVGKRYRYLVLGKTLATVTKPSKDVTIGAHRLVCWAFEGVPKTTSAFACHSPRNCQPKLACASPIHLRFDTAEQNIADIARRKEFLKERQSVALITTNIRRKQIREVHARKRAMLGRPG